MDRVLDSVMRGAPQAEIDDAVARAARRSARHRHVFQILTGLLLLLAIGAAFYFQLLNHQLAASVSQMQTLREAMQENRRLLGLTLDLETALRGYLLSGNDMHLEAYKAADDAIPQQVSILEEMLDDRPTLLAELSQIKKTLGAKRLQLAAVQESYQRGGDRESQRTYGRDLGQGRTDSLRNSVGAIETYLEGASLQERQISSELMDRQFTSILITLGAVGLIGVAAMLLGRRHFLTVRRHSELSVALARSQRTSEDKTVFLAQVSHEIRTPMNAIFGFSGLLQDRLDDPDNLRYIDAITSSAHALLGVVNDLLDYSSIESGKVTLARRPCDLREIVDSATSLLAPQAADKQLALTTTVDEALPTALLMDGDRVRQMLLNLVGNAIKYTDSGSVTVSVSAHSGALPQTATCRIEVIDTGPGIEEEDQARIFEPFSRCGPSGLGGGTGLGLSITRQLARAMGGEVSLVSRPGEGSRFCLTLPDLQITPDAVEHRHAGMRLRDLPPLRALAVDDVALNLEVMKAIFENTGHELRVAHNAQEALSIVEHWMPDLAMLDIRMAEMDGLELARQLRQRPDAQALRLVAVTATRLDTHGDDAALFDGFVLKPFTEQALSLVLAHVFRVGESPSEALRPCDAAPRSTAQMIEELHGLQPRWRALRSSLTINEVRGFAETLHAVGQRHASVEIERYGRSLLSSAAAFDVAQMEMLLETFPARVAEAERLLDTAAHEPA
ncbi:ATP-binding protein [Sinimarinibacterium flocculans]|uniref:ATP-binding protein n=1 Tax=Sinimarinibacterium flocculans TaxID=985250 RepID=UPI0024920EAE|nr:ATP-binding protein [Sinimarinibacterium flocculans]